MRVEAQYDHRAVARNVPVPAVVGQRVPHSIGQSAPIDLIRGEPTVVNQTETTNKYQ